MGWRHDKHWSAHSLLKTLSIDVELCEQADALCREFSDVIYPPGVTPQLQQPVNLQPVDQGSPGTFTFADLCCGTGIASWVLERNLGGRCVLACDVDKACQKTYLANFVGHKFRASPMFKVNPTQPCDVLVCGFPCQPYSKANRGKGREHVKGLQCEKGQVFYELLIKMEQLHPKVAILENVPELLKHRDWNTTMKNDLTGCCHGYVLFEMVLNARKFGVPQNRDRLFLVAVQRSLVTPDLRVAMERVTKSLCERELQQTSIQDSVIACGFDDAPELSAVEMEAMLLWDRLVKWSIATDNRLPGSKTINPKEFIDTGVETETKFFQVHQNDAALAQWLKDFDIAYPALKASKSLSFAKARFSLAAVASGSVWNCTCQKRGYNVSFDCNDQFLHVVTASSWGVFYGPARRWMTAKHACKIQMFPADYVWPLQDNNANVKLLGNAIAYPVMKEVCSTVLPLVVNVVVRNSESTALETE